MLSLLLLSCSPDSGVPVDDLDLDDDGALSSAEAAAGTDPLSPDTDGDGQSDGAELEAGTDPLSAFSRVYAGGYRTAGCGRTPPRATGWFVGDVAHNIRLLDQHEEVVDLYSFCGVPITVTVCACEASAGACDTCAAQVRATAADGTQSIVVLTGYLGSPDTSTASLAALDEAIGLERIPVLADPDFLWLSMTERDWLVPSVVTLSADMTIRYADGAE